MNCSTCGGDGCYDDSAPDAHAPDVVTCGRCYGTGDEPCEVVHLEPHTYQVVFRCSAAAEVERWIVDEHDERMAHKMALCHAHAKMLDERSVL